MRKAISWVTMIAGLIAACSLFTGIVRDQWEIAPYRPLLHSLGSVKADERLEAAMELGILRLNGASPKMAVLPLIERLDDPDSRVREAAADSLAWFGHDAAPATPALARIIQNDQSSLRARALRIVCLINSEEANSILAEAMTDPDPHRRIETARVIGNHSIMATLYVPLLLESLRRDPSPSVRIAILSALVAIEPTSDRVARARLEAMSDPDPEPRKAAVLGLGSPDRLSSILSSISLSFSSLLLRAAGDRDVGVRVEAIRMLHRIGLKHPDAVPALCRALNDPATRSEARIAISHLDWLWRLEDVASLDAVLESVVPALVAAARQADPRSKGVIVSLLCRQICQIGREKLPLPNALRAAVPQLLEIVNDAEPIVRLYALLALLEEPPNELLLPVLEQVLRERNSPSREQADPLDDPWPAAIAAVGAKLRYRDFAPKHHLLINLFPEDLIERLLPTIAAATNDDDSDVREGAIILLGSVANGQASRAAHSRCLFRATLPAIMVTLKSRFPEIRGNASALLGDLGAVAEQAVPALREMLAKESDPTVRARAEQALSYIGVASKRQDAP